MKNFKKILISFAIIFVFSIINTPRVSSAVPKATFPTINPIQPKPENIGPYISKDVNDKNNNYFYLNKEGNYEPPNFEEKIITQNSYSEKTTTEKVKSGVSPIFFIGAISIIVLLFSFIYTKVIHKE